ncbi:HAD-IA family hydrolase [Rhodoluna limnophila]|uniref:HAD-IA family hydrolase n=1 Tax=Rhodoluna limnophila TaxID=232537 RepID=UPI001105BC36|nr:HAD-IA family hydrolase [Rhodoluna limnophila]
MKFSASGLLFDNDGVLVDSHDAAIAAWATWSSEYAPDWDWNTSENAGVRAEDQVRERVAPELFEEANNRINQLEQDTAGQTVALGGAFELLHSLRPGIWTVCTSANGNLGRARLEAAGLPVPAELVSASDVKRGKPFPDPYLLGAERLGFNIHDCVVFEDAIAGVQAAIEAEAGLIIGVSERALLSDADIVVRDLSGITFDGETLVIPDNNRLR